VQYFDTWRGVSRYNLRINGQSVATWAADDTLPPAQLDPNLDGQDSTRFTAHDVALKPGDTLELSGAPDVRPELAPPSAPATGAATTPVRRPPDLRELAPVDYIEIGPSGPITPQ
jgi:alpha-glucuronidase